MHRIDSQCEVLSQAIAIQNSHKRPLAGPSAARLTLLVHSATRDDKPPPIDLAAAVNVYILGRALLDDLVDGDLAPEFRGRGSRTVTVDRNTAFCNDAPVIPVGH